MFKLRFILLVFFVSILNTHAATTWLGNRRALVLALEWSNKKAPVNMQDLNDAFFTTGTYSLHDYFLENSSGKFNLTGDVFNFKKTDLKWNDDLGCNPKEIARIAMDVFKDDINISNYDSDKDGKIDHLFIVHSGRMPSDRVGPSCMFTRTDANETAVFQAQGVGSIGSAIPLGFYVHEAGHALYGFPDLYGNHYGGRYGIGMWGMMGLGCWGLNNSMATEELFRIPSHFEPRSKIKIGWSTPQTITDTTKNVILRPIELTGDIVHIGKNYYLEYRSKNGFSKDHAGHGLLIWKGYTIIQADGRNDINSGTGLGYRPLPPNQENFGDDSDPFPGSLNVTSYEDKEAGILIENITMSEETITFDVTISEGTGTEELQTPWINKQKHQNHL